MKKMYPAVVNSPKTELSETITEFQTEIKIADPSVLINGAGIAVIGNGDVAETILYESIDHNTLLGCTRGYQGTARPWIAGTRVSRNFTAADWDTARQNIEGLYDRLDAVETKSLTLQPGMQVIQGSKFPAIAFPKVEGRTLINLIGSIGNGESVIPWSPVSTTVTLDTTHKVEGPSSFKVVADGTTLKEHFAGQLGNTFLKGNTCYLASAYIKAITGRSYLRMIVFAGNVVTADYGDLATKVTDTSKFTYVTQAFKTSSSSDRLALRLQVDDASGAYFDNISLYEISEAELAAINSMTAEQVAAKYPYVGTGIYGVTNPTITSVQDNLLPPFSEYSGLGDTFRVESPYKAVINSTGNITYSVTFPALPQTNYTLSLEHTGVVALVPLNAAGASLADGSPSFGWNTSQKFTVTTPIGTTQLVFSVKNLHDASGLNKDIYFNNPMLVTGVEGQPFKPQRKTDLIVKTELHSNVSGSVKDTLEYVDGTPRKLKRWEKILLTGALGWGQIGKIEGSTIVQIKGLAPSIMFDALFMTKYDGKLIVPVGGLTAPDQAHLTIASGYKDLSITVSNADSGWGPNYTPTDLEIRSYFNGWRMRVWNTADPYNGVGEKAWASLASGGGSYWTSMLPTAKAPDCTHYQMLYALRDPVLEGVRSRGAAVVESGDNYVSLSSDKVPAVTASIEYADSMISALSTIEREIARVDKYHQSTMQMPNYTDADTLVTNGRFSIWLGRNVPTADHGVIYFDVLDFNGTGEFVSQTAYFYGDNRVWTRRKIQERWTAWSEFRSATSNPKSLTHIQAFPTGDQSIAENVSTKLTLNSVARDFLAEYNPSLSEFTSKYEGVYAVDVTAYIVALAAGHSATLMLYVNGSPLYAIGRIVSGANTWHLLTGHMDIYLPAGQTLEVYISSTTPITLAAGGDSRRLSITRLT